MAANLSHPVSRKKVAIVGSGCAGIAALWALNRTHHDVYLYEAADRLGGHANTVEFRRGKYKTAVDAGFTVMNPATYPNFMAFLKAVNVPTEPTEMTFAVSRDYGRFEWASASFSSLLAQARNMLSPRMWRMVFDILRFNQFALDLLAEDQVFADQDGHADEYDDDYEETIGEYLEREGYSAAFRDDYLIPIASAIWNTGPDKCILQFPAVILVRFMLNNKLLRTSGPKSQWLVLENGSKSYVDAVMKGFPPNHLFLNTPIASVTSDSSGKVLVRCENGKIDVYDHVILATHGNQALDLISASATPMERSILSAFQTSKNTAILHSDTSLMPRDRAAWSAWNYLTFSPSPSTTMPSYFSKMDQACLTYNMNILQHIPASAFGDVFVTLNPPYSPPPSKVHGSYTYSHTLYTATAIRSQPLLAYIQNTRGISYCGAWTKHGFHEDALSSGLKVAVDHLGARLPFDIHHAKNSRTERPRQGMKDYTLKVCIMWVQLIVVVIDKLVHVAKVRGKTFKTVMVTKIKMGW